MVRAVVIGDGHGGAHHLVGGNDRVDNGRGGAGGALARRLRELVVRVVRRMNEEERATRTGERHDSRREDTWLEHHEKPRKPTCSSCSHGATRSSKQRAPSDAKGPPQRIKQSPATCEGKQRRLGQGARSTRSAAIDVETTMKLSDCRGPVFYRKIAQKRALACCWLSAGRARPALVSFPELRYSRCGEAFSFRSRSAGAVVGGARARAGWWG